MNSVLVKSIESSRQLVIQQIKEWVEIVVNFETKNKYELHTASGEMLGYIIEPDTGFLGSLKGLVLCSHRPLKIDILDSGSHGRDSLRRHVLTQTVSSLITVIQHGCSSKISSSCVPRSASILIFLRIIKQTIINPEWNQCLC